MQFFKRKRETTTPCDYIIVDLETSGLNVRSCEILEIAAIKILGGRIVDSFSSLVRPYFPIEKAALKVNKISLDELSRAPDARDVMPHFFKFISNHKIGGFNISSYDWPIITRYAEAFNYRLQNDIFDILFLARRKLPHLENRRLSSLAAYLQIDTSGSHRALKDCEITQQVLQCLLRLPDVECYEKKQKKYYTKSTEQSKALNELNIALQGVVADGILEEREVYFLRNWLENNKHLNGNYPYDKVRNMIEDALADNILTESEMAELFSIFNDFIEGKIDCPDVNIETIQGMSIVLTGDFGFGAKSEVSEFIISRGGIVKSSVSRKTDLLIVGSLGSTDWLTGNYGTKIKTAKEIQAKGGKVIIISEEEFFNQVE